MIRIRTIIIILVVCWLIFGVIWRFIASSFIWGFMFVLMLFATACGVIAIRQKIRGNKNRDLRLL
ncbi:TPA: hypothetical protein DF272_05935 [Candidatus Falkowbacteria bacterium]|nr:hypothetical protein [Candidatus Falkowbacteria bacterium]